MQSTRPVLLCLFLLLLRLSAVHGCAEDSDCVGEGSTCVNQTCQCRPNPYYSPMEPDCSSGLEAFERLGLTNLWLAYLVFICVASAVGFLMSTGFLVHIIWTKKKFVPHVTNLSLLFVTASFFVRLLYFTVDPHGLYLIFPPALGRLIFALFHTFFFSAYSLLMLVWVELCGRKMPSSGSRTRRIKIPFLVINIVFYGFEVIMTSVQLATGTLSWIFSQVYSIYIALIILVTSIGHIVFSRRFLLLLNHQALFSSVARKLMAKKVTILSLVVSSILLLAVILQMLFIGLGAVLGKTNLAFIIEEWTIRLAENAVAFLLLYALMARSSSKTKDSEARSTTGSRAAKLGSGSLSFHEHTQEVQTSVSTKDEII